MSDEYGSDFITIIDEDGTEFELEILTTIEYNGDTYLAVTPATDEEAEDYARLYGIHPIKANDITRDGLPDHGKPQ